MKRPVKIILWIIGPLVGLFVIFFLVGVFAPNNHHGSQTIRLSASPEKVWDAITNIDNVPMRHSEIKKIETTGINDQGYKMWREYTDMGGFIDFEITQEVSQEKVVMHMNAPSFGMTGQWVYELKPFVVPAAFPGGEVDTDLTITEDSTTNNILVRAMMTIMGRNRNIQNEFEALKKVL